MSFHKILYQKCKIQFNKSNLFVYGCNRVNGKNNNKNTKYKINIIPKCIQRYKKIDGIKLEECFLEFGIKLIYRQ